MMTRKIYIHGLKLECVNRNAKFWINNVFLWNKVTVGAKYISSISNNIKKDCVPKIQHLYVFTWKHNRPAKDMMIPFYIKKTFLHIREERCSNEINTMVDTQVYINFNIAAIHRRLIFIWKLRLIAIGSRHCIKSFLSYQIEKWWSFSVYIVVEKSVVLYNIHELHLIQNKDIWNNIVILISIQYYLWSTKSYCNYQFMYT